MLRLSVYMALGFLILFSMLSFQVSSVCAIEVEGPVIVHPKLDATAPWERVKFRVNVTDADYPIEIVNLYYSNETEPDSYTQVTMDLVTGTSLNGTWVCEIPPQSNGTKISYYSEVIDSRDEDHSPINSEKPWGYIIVAYEPKFRLLSFSIEEIHEKELLADVKVSFEIYWNTSSNAFRMDIDNHGERIAFPLIEEGNTRFDFGTQLELEGIGLTGSGNPGDFPFDSYSLNLTFTFPVQNASTTFFPKLVHLAQIEQTNWVYESTNTTANTHSGSVIGVNINLERSEESRRYFIVPIILYAFMLGVTLLLGVKDYITQRLTVYLSLFVFSWQYSNLIGDFAPTIAKGVTSIEILMNFLGYFTAIFLIISFLEKFKFSDDDERKNRLQEINFEVIALIITSIIYFCYPVVTIPDFEKTLFTSIPLVYGVLIYFGLVFGCIASLYWRRKKMDDKERERVLSEIHAQENSTLVISTVASSASLAILSTVTGNSENFLIGSGLVAVFFALLGFTYREMTIHFSEIRKYREIRKSQYSSDFPIFLRMLVIRWFLLSPVIFFSAIMPQSNAGIGMLFTLKIALLLSICEMARRIE